MLRYIVLSLDQLIRLGSIWLCVRMSSCLRNQEKLSSCTKARYHWNDKWVERLIGLGHSWFGDGTMHNLGWKKVMDPQCKRYRFFSKSNWVRDLSLPPSPFLFHLRIRGIRFQNHNGGFKIILVTMIFHGTNTRHTQQRTRQQIKLFLHISGKVRNCD